MNPNLIHGRVEQSDIDLPHNDKTCVTDCMLTTSLKRALPEWTTAHVGISYATILRPEKTALAVSISPAIARHISDWCHGRKDVIAPFDYTLDLEKGTLS